MLRKIIISIFILCMVVITNNYVQASSYEWDIGGLKQMDYDSIQAEEIEIELTFYCGVNNAMEGGGTTAAGKPVVYGNLANNYYTGIKSINGGKSWENLNNGYALGTNVYIKDVGLFSVEDRGGSEDFNNQNRMDLFVARKDGESDADYEKRTNSYGHVKVKAKIVPNGKERIWAWPSGDSIASSTATSSSQTSTGKLNFKVVYNNSKGVSMSGSRPTTLTANCKDAVELYWTRITSVMGETSTASESSIENGITSVQVPSNIDSSQWIYPLTSRHTLDPTTGARFFGAGRDGGARAHAGIDLIVPPGVSVVAMTDGTVLSIYNFYQNTNAVEVKNDDGTVVRYTEIKENSNIKVNQKIKKGDILGKVIRNLAGSSMLHVEVYDGSGTGPLTIANSSNYKNVPVKNYKRRSDLMNPTFVKDLPMAVVE